MDADDDDEPANNDSDGEDERASLAEEERLHKQQEAVRSYVTEHQMLDVFTVYA